VILKVLPPALPLIVVLCLCPTVVLAGSSEGVPLRHQACVVLLHGLFRSAVAMKPIEWQLEEAGFWVANESYPSLRYPIPELATIAVEAGVSQCHEQGLERIHFVTHSLGGILVREYLRTGSIPGLDRVVMLGPPNQGSQVADALNAIDFLEPLTPAAASQLGTGEDSVPAHLGPVSFELGVIAGTFNWRRNLPGFPDEDGDGTVTVAETFVPGMLDFLELPVSHTSMIWSSEVARQAVYFLRHGQFDRPIPKM
jgi:triacylglycerol lipase